MLTRKIVVESTDGKHIGQEVITSDGEAIVGDFSFDYVKVIDNRIIGPNYTVVFEEEN